MSVDVETKPFSAIVSPVKSVIETTITCKNKDEYAEIEQKLNQLTRFDDFIKIRIIDLKEIVIESSDYAIIK